MDASTLPVIILYSHTVGLAVIRSLGRHGVPLTVLHYLPSEFGFTSRYVTAHHEVAHPGEDEEQFIANILALKEELAGALLVPTDDYTLVAVSRHRDRLSPHFRVCAERWDLVRQLISKQETYEFAEAHGIPCPRSRGVDSEDDLEAAIAALEFPCLVKPRDGHVFYDLFRCKMFRVDSRDQMVAAFRRCREARISVMAQELIPGDDTQGVNYNSYRIDGAPVAEFTGRKVRIDPPFFGSPRVLVSRHIPEIIEPGRKLLHLLGFEGFSCMEFKRDARSGIYKLMEVNGRHNLSGSLAPACGIDFPWIMYRHMALNERPPLQGRFQEGVYWIDLTKDAARFFTTRHVEGYTLRQYLQPYLHRKVFAVLDWRDPAPFFRRLQVPLRKARAAARKRRQAQQAASAVAAAQKG